MKCQRCGTETKHGGTFQTLVGFGTFTDALGEHEHNDNCLKRYYRCMNCKNDWIESIRRTCSLKACDWKGKTSCFCHDGEKVDTWTDAETA